MDILECQTTVLWLSLESQRLQILRRVVRPAAQLRRKERVHGFPANIPLLAAATALLRDARQRELTTRRPLDTSHRRATMLRPPTRRSGPAVVLRHATDASRTSRFEQVESAGKDRRRPVIARRRNPGACPSGVARAPRALHLLQRRLSGFHPALVSLRRDGGSLHVRCVVVVFIGRAIIQTQHGAMRRGVAPLLCVLTWLHTFCRNSRGNRTARQETLWEQTSTKRDSSHPHITQRRRRGTRK